MNMNELLVTLLRSGVELRVQDGKLSYRAPKGALAPALREELAAHKTDVTALLEEGRKYLLCSFAQERLWFLHQLEPESPVYNVPLALRLSGHLDVGVLEQSLDGIIRRHETLRTTFTAFEGLAVQVVHPAAGFRFSVLEPGVEPSHAQNPIIDLRSEPEPERQAALNRLVDEQAWQPFDLAQGPLLRATLFRLSDQEHVLLVNLHHIVTDGWSMHVFFREMAALYGAFAAGELSPLPELDTQYTNFSQWQRQWLQGEASESQLAYWEERLSDVPVLQLPTDRPRPAVQTYSIGKERLMLSAALTEALRELSRREGVTLFMTMLAAFKTLLYRYTDQEDFSVGSFVANRNQPETEGLIGFFVNNLALRTDLAGRPTVRELLSRVRDVTLGAYAHQDIPFEKVLEAVQPERVLSHTPLFQVMCVLQNFPTLIHELPGLALSLMETANRKSDFDLTLWILERGPVFSLEIEYNPDLFDPSTIARMEQHLQVLLEGMAAHPDQRISDLPLLTPAERQQMLVEWNSAPLERPSDQYAHHLFETQAQRTPDAIAVMCQDRRLTFRELDQRANSLARYLQTFGVRPDSLVGVYMDRSPEMVISLLGILKAGGAYLPLDPLYPRERLAFMLQDARPAALLAQPQGLVDWQDCGAPTVCLDAAHWTLDDLPWTLDTQPVQADSLAPGNLAYVIYTSGSTGQPKGVLVTHQSLTSYLKAILPPLQLNPHDRVLQFASFSFDATTEELFPALLSGATVVLRPATIRAPGAEFTRLIEQTQLTVLSLPVAFWHEWVYELARSPEPLQSSLRMVLLNAEEPSPERFAAWMALGQGHIRWINTYGPTETTVTAALFEPVSEAEQRKTWLKMPLGRPLANTHLYVLDRHLQPVPVGVPGELYIGGGGLTRGYLNHPDRTAETFVPHPLPPPQAVGARLYRTGDVVRYLPDGNLEFLGRTDSQVKLRGYRVELGEIEAVLGQHPAVREATVVIREDVPGQKRLAAYVVPDRASPLMREQPGGESLVEELSHFMGGRLPDYMLPTAWVMLEALPLTPNGKIDRRALPAPLAGPAEARKDFVAPHTLEEELLADIWTQILGVAPVGIHDNFFKLGGHSLLATQFVSRVRDIFHVELPLRSLFETPTIAELALTIEEMLLEQIEHLAEDDVEYRLEGQDAH